MSAQPKLRSGPTSLQAAMAVLAVGILYLGATILEGELFQTHFTQWIYGMLIIAAALAFAVRYRAMPVVGRWVIAIGGILVGSGAWHYELAHHHDTVLSDHTFLFHTAVMFGFFAATIPWLLLRRLLRELQSRQLFELAARPIEEAGAGFTPRPYPAGRVTVTPAELGEFATYLERTLPVDAVRNGNNVTFYFAATPAGASPGGDSFSFVRFDHDGQVTVFVNEMDYRQYRENLTFDQLCEAFARLFTGFLDDYRTGKGEAIAAALRTAPSWEQQRRLVGLALLAAGLVLFALIAIYTLAT